MSMLIKEHYDIEGRIKESKRKLDEAKARRESLYSSIYDLEALIHALEFNVELYEAILKEQSK